MDDEKRDASRPADDGEDTDDLADGTLDADEVDPDLDPWDEGADDEL